MFRLVVLLSAFISFLASADIQKYLDVIDANASKQGDYYRFSVTISSPYDTPQRYADAYRILDENGNELGVRILWHDHANEQPFTRSLNNVVIPEDVETVVIQGRDKQYGWGGKTIELTIE